MRRLNPLYTHTLGGSGEGRVQGEMEVERVQMILGSTVRHTLMHQSHLVLGPVPCGVVWTGGPSQIWRFHRISGTEDHVALRFPLFRMCVYLQQNKKGREPREKDQYDEQKSRESTKIKHPCPGT